MKYRGNGESYTASNFIILIHYRIIRAVKLRRFRWGEIPSRLSNTCIILVRKPGESLSRRLNCTCEYNIKMLLSRLSGKGVNCTGVAEQWSNSAVL
jgi:hypothetical protein